MTVWVWMLMGHIFLVFDLLRDQLYSIFRLIPMFIQAWVSLDRVNDFLHNVSESVFVLLLDI